ncbi:MAG: hypothetical protein MUF18_03110 [Fimbriiglobus sp.]|jgi:hypothetical protein|nr:hypothetical protein [Fimbriiglobus sp.]
MRRLLALSVFTAFTLPALADDKPGPVKFSGLSGEPPATWKAEKPANLLRSHQFKLPSDDKTYADAELTVSPKSSDDVTKNFDKWKTQFTPPDGKKVEDVTKTSSFEVSGVKVHVLDVSGTWKYKERPFDPKSKEEIKPEYRAVWVIVVGKDDTTHLRLSGPQAVVGKHYAEFEKWLKGLK